MTQSSDVLRYIKATLIFGMMMIVLMLFRSGTSLDFSNFLILGGVSAIGLFAFCRIMEQLVHMVDE